MTSIVTHILTAIVFLIIGLAAGYWLGWWGANVMHSRENRDQVPENRSQKP